jgi:hypothetical protein
MKTYISIELYIGRLKGSRAATQVFDATEDVEVSLETHAYNSDATEEGEGPLFDIEVSWFGEEREKTEDRPYGGNHRVKANATLDQKQARALRDQINAFLELK